MKGKIMIIVLLGLGAVLAMTSCKSGGSGMPELSKEALAEADAAVAANPDNPFFKPYGTPFNVPPFDRIKEEHYLPAGSTTPRPPDRRAC